MTLIIPLLIFLVFLVLGISVFRRQGKILLQMAAMFLVAYALILGETQYYEHKYMGELEAYDTNGDGLYSSSEQIEGFEKAMEHVTHDTGRTFAPILGFIISAILALLLGVVLKLQSIVLHKRESKSGVT